MAFSSFALLLGPEELEEPMENNFFLFGDSEPLRVVAVETVEWVEAVSLDGDLEDLNVLERKFDILNWMCR